MTSSTNASISSNKLIKWVIISNALAVAALVIAYAAIREARAKRSEIVLADDDGRTRVRIAATLNGSAIELLDERGVARIALRQAGDALSISMHRKEAEGEAIQLVVQDTGYPIVSLRAPDRSTVALGARDGGDLILTGPKTRVVVASSPIRSGLFADF